MYKPDEARRQRTLLRRFEAMGLEAVLLSGGRCVVATLPLGPEPLATLGRPRRVPAVRFVTVGADRIKCLAPRALFYLPLIPFGDCETPRALEARIREAWQRRVFELERAGTWLDGLGLDTTSPGDTPQWTFALAGEDPQARAACIEAHRVILPSRGLLTGVTLTAAGDRSFRVGPAVGSAVDLEIAISSRLESLALRDREAQARRRRRAATLPNARHGAGRSLRKLLLVGAGLCADRALQDSLHLRDFQVHGARGIQEAVEAFAERSFELVLAEYHLDRSDGIEVIPALRAVPGLARVPILLVDERARDTRRDAARRAGASGYLAQPLDVPKLAPVLSRLVRDSRDRRFARFDRPLAVSWIDDAEPGVTRNVGRGGMFVRTERELPVGASERVRIRLPEFAENLQVEGEVVYGLDGSGALDRGVGLRFRAFPDADEAMWIAYLRHLQPTGTAAPPAP